MSIFSDSICEIKKLTRQEYPLWRGETSLHIDYNVLSNREQFGDCSINIALLVAKEYKKNPREVAEQLRSLCLQEIKKIKEIEIAGPGFLNIFFLDVLYLSYMNTLLSDLSLLFDRTILQEKYNVEFVSANPTGLLHVGHGRGAIIGDVLSAVLKERGYNVTREYIINDAGKQIDVLGESLEAFCEGKENELSQGTYRGQYLREIADSLGEQKQSMSKEAMRNYAVDSIMQIIQKTLSDYGVTFDRFFSEKTLHVSGKIEEAVCFLRDKGYVYADDEGVLWFSSTRFGDDKDRVLKKRDGDWTYTATDVAYLQDKIRRGYTKIVMVLGQDHHSFKERLEGICEALGFPRENFHILLYQLVTLKNDDEVFRMSKREGKIVSLSDIIDTVGTNAARFFYLQRKADAHLDFDISQALLKTTENPVFYIQYAYVRMVSLLSKFPLPDSLLKENFDEYNLSVYEKRLLKKISLFTNTLDSIISSLEPHHLTYYTLELCQLFHAFYTAHKIITENYCETLFRMRLVFLVKEVLEKCGKLLGITYPPSM
jgi:arginyl-tRNA synthetase